MGNGKKAKLKRALRYEKRSVKIARDALEKVRAENARFWKERDAADENARFWKETSHRGEQYLALLRACEKAGVEVIRDENGRLTESVKPPSAEDVIRLYDEAIEKTWPGTTVVRHSNFPRSKVFRVDIEPPPRRKVKSARTAVEEASAACWKERYQSTIRLHEEAIKAIIRLCGEAIEKTWPGTRTIPVFSGSKVTRFDIEPPPRAVEEPTETAAYWKAQAEGLERELAQVRREFREEVTLAAYGCCDDEKRALRNVALTDPERAFLETLASSLDERIGGYSPDARRLREMAQKGRAKAPSAGTEGAQPEGTIQKPQAKETD